MTIPPWLKNVGALAVPFAFALGIVGIFRALMVGWRPVFMPLEWAVLTAVGAAGGALGGAAVTVRMARRAAGMSIRESTGQGAGFAAVFVLYQFVSRDLPAALDCYHSAFAIAMGLFCGAMYGTVNRAAYLFGRAVLGLSRGDREGARQAIREYLEKASGDPLRELRVPVARRFLDGESASLDVATELLATEAPAGRGTEPERASAPAGRGTELEGQ